MKDLKSYTEIKKSIYDKKVNLADILDVCLENIKDHTDLNAFARVYSEEARERALKIQEEIFSDTSKLLAGMVIGIKDLFSYKDHPLQAASKILENYISPFNATVVTRILDHGAIIIGHQNCDEFGMGSSNENSVYGLVRNRLNKNLVPGGSSGGSAVAVQASMCHVSLGTDTGGSVRQPAAFCGIIGLKPTYSRISRYGVVAYASSLDTVGILSRSIDDCAVVLEAIAGKDEKDNTSSRKDTEKYTQNLALQSKVKVAYIKEALEFKNIQSAIRICVKNTLKNIADRGHTVGGIDFPLLKYTLPTYYVIANAEASTNLSCYDGVRYGHRASSFDSVKDMYVKTRTQAFGDEVKRRIITGTYILSEGSHYDWLLQAQKVRKILQEDIHKIFFDYDFIVMPTTPTTAFEIGKDQDPLDTYVADMYTVLASITGVPAISIPVGTDNNNLPIGLQIIAAPFQEKKLLAFSKELMQKA